MPERRRFPWTAVLAFVAVGALGLALWRSNPRAAAEELARMPAGHIGQVLVLVLAGYFLRFVKWHFFLTRLKAPIGPARSAAIFASGLLMVVTPAKVGEIWKAFALQESTGLPLSRGIGAVALERITDILAIAALAVLGAATLGLAPWLAALSLTGFVAGVLLLRWRRPWLALLARQQIRRPHSRAVAFLHALYLDTASLLATATLLPGALVGLVAWTCEGLALWVILDGLGIAAPMLWAIGVFAAGSLAGGLSVLPGGLGTAEAGMVALLVAGGVASPTAFAATLLIRVMTLGFGAAVGGVSYLGWLAHSRRALIA